MAYKKYIKRGDKTYGPYIYHSRRENGQVITEYRGKKNNKNFFKIFLFIFIGIFVLIGIYSILSNLSFYGFTGLASLQLATDYRPNETVEGVLRLSLLKGELIPQDTSVIVNIAGEEYNYSLIELISEEGIEGNYYVQDSGISGTGLGYGSKGVKYSAPEVNFKLNVVHINKTSSEKNVETTSSNESTNSETFSSESNISETEAVPAEPQQNESPEETEPSASENAKDNSAENTQSPEDSVTGKIIKFFTGLVSLDFTNEKIGESVEGKVVYGENVKYKIPDGKTAVLSEGSVSSGGEKIDDSYINVDISGNVAIVSTNYRNAEYGFGEDYVSDNKVYYNINLSKLDLIAKEGRMNIKLIFNNSVLAETNSDLAVSEKELNATEENISIGAEPFTLEDPSIYNLTDDEIKLLAEKAGTISVNITQSEILNGRLVLKYELGDYWTEFSYDYEGKLSKNLLDKIELERRYWLKNLAKELSKKNPGAENVDSLVVGFKLNESNNLNVKIKEENVSNVVEREIKQEENETILQNETSEETEPSASQNQINSTENINQTSESVITGQIVFQPQSQTNLFGRFRDFIKNLFR